MSNVRFAGICVSIVLSMTMSGATELTAASRGTLHTARLLRHFTAGEIDAAGQQDIAIVGAAECGVAVIELRYATIGVNGEPADASAVLLLPEGPGCAGKHPLLAWGHGTETRRDATLAELAAKEANYELSAFYASKGYAVVATDYLGLGKSHYPFHPYLHAASEASAIIDALRAARNAGPLFGARYSGQIMLAGYSQGGHAAMAAQRAIDASHLDEFDLVATAPMSGAYALSRSFLTSWTGDHGDEANPFAPFLLSYAVVAMQRAYGNVYGRPEEVFRPSAAAVVEQMFPGPCDLTELADRGPLAQVRSIDDLRQPDFSWSFLQAPGNAFLAALKRNDLLEWTPKTPMVLCGAAHDSIVTFDNAIEAQIAFAARGARVAVVDVSDRVPPGASGADIHTSWAAYFCQDTIRRTVFDPAWRQSTTAKDG